MCLNLSSTFESLARLAPKSTLGSSPEVGRTCGDLCGCWERAVQRAAFPLPDFALNFKNHGDVYPLITPQHLSNLAGMLLIFSACFTTTTTTTTKATVFRNVHCNQKLVSALTHTLKQRDNYLITTFNPVLVSSSKLFNCFSYFSD